MTMALLQVQGLQAGYGASRVLHGIDLTVGDGCIVTLLGKNGMGKTTTLKSVMGLLPKQAGGVHFAGRDITRMAAFEVARLGLGWVPEGRQVFPTLTVQENLVATAANRHGATQPFTLQRVYGFFPRLAERAANLGNQLSGGEQQMLAIGRALMTNPKLLVLDEATEGLAPLVRAEIWRVLGALRATGMAMLVVDKNLGALMDLADQHVVLEKGRVVWQGDSAALRADQATVQGHLGL
ncbi:ABC transporter ATP-binding protein [Pseudorhodoferax sp. Leaf274]|uniref:ABC transporter ATP-binding protein n=1 Tax=Pseudorhodoferax sp. Leaf274 TaxID=1736318 RepID=UPI0007035F34|nr:ABC transporter ATP-binding protein [Pseudorhodoferax sp. Leaf274]KQP35252.1 ABC transporter ATP-binding protein [Pseudorhodoferax sp. Leaf274]